MMINSCTGASNNDRLVYNTTEERKGKSQVRIYFELLIQNKCYSINGRYTYNCVRRLVGMVYLELNTEPLLRGLNIVSLVSTESGST